MAVSTTAAQKISRTKRVVRSQADSSSEPKPNLGTTQPSTSYVISELTSKISQIQEEFDSLEKEITQTKEKWTREQKDHEAEIQQRNLQEDLDRKRRQESYEYELQRNYKKAADEFEDQKAAQQKDLGARREEIEKDKKELIDLRKQSEIFDSQKAEAVRLAQSALKEELTEKFNAERKLREQEFKAEKEILNLKINTLSTENSKQAVEINTLKKALEEATRQLKEIAVRVIDASGAAVRTSHQAENSTP